MDLSFLGPLGTFLALLGGGIVWLFNRADKQREARENSAIGILKNQNSALLRQLREAQHESKSRLRDGNKWREQLIKNGLIPDPGDWADMRGQE